MHAISRTQLENRSLQHVECPVQERAALLSRSYPSLRSHDLSRSDLETLGSYTELFRVAAGTMIFHEATPGSWMALVVSGEVEIRKLDAAQRDRVLATIGPGNLLGEMAFLDGQTRSATAISNSTRRRRPASSSSTSMPPVRSTSPRARTVRSS